MAEVFTHPFTTYDGTLISSQKELDDWCKENNKFTPTDSMEDLQRQEKKIQDRKDKEEKRRLPLRILFLRCYSGEQKHTED